MRKIGNQDAPFYYIMMFKDGDDPSNLVPLAVALLSDHSTGGISTFLLTVRKILVMVKRKSQMPSFFVCDFSMAIINALLMIFSHENLDSHLERCWSMLHKKYSLAELRSSFIIRLCCAHVMRAFVRSLHEMKLKKTERHCCTKLFAVLLNTDTLENAFDLFGKMLTIYGDSNASNTDQLLLPIVDVTNVLQFDLEEYLKDELEAAEECVTPSIEDTFASSTATIHRSPFAREVRNRFPLVGSILKRKNDKTNNKSNTCNPHYHLDIILALYRWFAYLPLWTCIMSDYYER